MRLWVPCRAGSQSALSRSEDKWSSLCFYCTFYRICDQLRRRFLYTYRAVYPAYDLVFSISSLCTIASLPCSPSTPSRTNQRYFQGSMNATPYIKSLQRSIPQSNPITSKSNHFHRITYTQPNAAERHCTPDLSSSRLALDAFLAGRILARITSQIHRTSVHHRERLLKTEVEAVE